MPSSSLSAADQRMFTAIGNADAGALRQALVDGANPNATGLRGRTALHAATENQPAYHRARHMSADEMADSMVRLLTMAGASLDIPDSRGNTPLHAATRFEFHAVVRRLLSGSVDANRLDANGWSPLFIAANNHDHRSMELLLKHGATMNHPLRAANHQTLWAWASENAEKEGRGPHRETFIVLERFALGMDAAFEPVNEPRLRARL